MQRRREYWGKGERMWRQDQKLKLKESMLVSKGEGCKAPRNGGDSSPGENLQDDL